MDVKNIIDDGIKVGCSAKNCKELMERPNLKEGWALLNVFIVSGNTEIPMVQTEVVLCPTHWMKLYETLIISES